MFDKFTERAIYTVMLAQEEARKLGHNYVGTGMMLLGVLGEGGKATRILEAFGITLETAREEVLSLIGRGCGRVQAEIPYTDNANHVLEVACEEAEKRLIKDVAVPHLLFGLLSGKETMAIRVFDVMGVNVEETRKLVLEELDRGYGPRAEVERR